MPSCKFYSSTPSTHHFFSLRLQTLVKIKTKFPLNELFKNLSRIPKETERERREEKGGRGSKGSGL